MTTYLADKGRAVLGNGFSILPIRPGSKAPSIDGWLDVTATGEVLAGWLANGKAYDGLGIKTRHTPFVDLDTTSKPALRHIINWIEINIGFAPVRIGNAPKRGLLFRSEQPFRKISSRVYNDSQGHKAQVEILGDGQQFVSFAIHPDTKLPYRWLHGDSPETTAACDLPLLTAEDGRRIVDEFQRYAEEQGWQLRPRPGLPAPVNRVDRQSGDEAPGFMDDEWGLGTEPMGLTEDEIRRRLMMVPNDDRFDAREDWLRIGMAVHHETGGSEFGRELWLDWSEQHGSHIQAEFDKSWNSFGKRDGSVRGVTFRFVLKLSREYEKGERRNLIAGLVKQFKTVTTGDELRAVSIECRKLDTDQVDLAQLVDAYRKAATKIGSPETTRDARKMVGYRPNGPPDWLVDWCYLLHTKQFNNRETGVRIDREAFDASFGRNISAMLPSKFALDVMKIPIYQMAIYLPGAGDTFSDSHGVEWINSYSTKTLPAMPAVFDRDNMRDIEMVENHGYHLFDNEHDINLLHSFLAYLVQKGRVNWAILMQGAEAIGKTFYADPMMSAVLGAGNVYAVNTDTLKSPFTSWAEGHQLTFVEELRLHGHNRFEIMDKLKPFITNSTIEIHPKGEKSYNVPNTTSYIAATNHVDALPLGVADSRYFVMQSRWQRKVLVDQFKLENPNYYTDLWAAVQRDPGAIRKWLLTYRLHPDFNPVGRAPMSIAKTRTIEQQKPDEAFLIEDIIESGNYPLVSNQILVFSALQEALSEATEMGVSNFGRSENQHLARLLQSLEFSYIGKTMVSKERLSVWTRDPLVVAETIEQVRKRIDQCNYPDQPRA